MGTEPGLDETLDVLGLLLELGNGDLDWWVEWDPASLSVMDAVDLHDWLRSLPFDPGISALLPSQAGLFTDRAQQELAIAAGADRSQIVVGTPFTVGVGPQTTLQAR